MDAPARRPLLPLLGAGLCLALAGCSGFASTEDGDAGARDGGSSLRDAGSLLSPSGELTGTVRDFHMASTAHPEWPIDFENPLFSNPSQDRDDRGVVGATLGADGTPVYTGPGTASPATTSGAANFNAWFHDVAGVNQAQRLTIKLTRDAGTGVYTYDNQSFFPLDGQLFGNETHEACKPCTGGSSACDHNYGFTFEIHTVFTYGGGETFKFTGDDDLWVFIDGKRVIDLGGIHVPETETVHLDSLSLTAGSQYNLDLFFAERHACGSHFRIDTELALSTTIN